MSTSVAGRSSLSGGFYNGRAVYERRGLEIGELSVGLGFQETWQNGTSATSTQGIHTRLPMLDLGYAHPLFSEQFLVGALLRNQFGNGALDDVTRLSSFQWLINLGPQVQYRVPIRLVGKKSELVVGAAVTYGLNGGSQRLWQFLGSVGLRVAIEASPAAPPQKNAEAPPPAPVVAAPDRATVKEDIAAGEVAQVMPDGVRVILPVSRVWFEVGDATISESGTEYLKALAAVLKAARWEKITINGHADRRGSAKINKRVSGARARKVETALKNAGLDGNRIRSFGVGSDRPLASTDDEAGWKLNRRAEVDVEIREADRAELARALNEVDRQFQQRGATP